MTRPIFFIVLFAVLLGAVIAAPDWYCTFGPSFDLCTATNICNYSQCPGGSVSIVTPQCLDASSQPVSGCANPPFCTDTTCPTWTCTGIDCSPCDFSTCSPQTTVGTISGSSICKYSSGFVATDDLCPTAATACPCPDYQWMVVDGTGAKISSGDYITKACSYTGCAASTQTSPAFAAGVSVKCVDVNHSNTPAANESSCTGSAKPTFGDVCGAACLKWQCVFGTAPVQDCPATTVEQCSYFSCSGSSGFPAVSDSTITCGDSNALLCGTSEPVYSCTDTTCPTWTCTGIDCSPCDFSTCSPQTTAGTIRGSSICKYSSGSAVATGDVATRCPTAATACPCPADYQWMVVDGTGAKIISNDYTTKACSYTGCAASTQTSPAFAAGVSVKCVDVNHSNTPAANESSCTGSAKPTFGDVCGAACLKWQCVFGTAPVQDCPATTVDQCDYSSCAYSTGAGQPMVPTITCGDSNALLCGTSKPFYSCTDTTCPTNKCSFIVGQVGSTMPTETVSCVATSCNDHYSDIFTNLPNTKTAFTDCTQTTDVVRNTYCVTSNNEIIAAKNCPAPTSLTCPRSCQSQCAWKLTSGAPLETADFASTKCSWLCETNAADINLTNCGEAADQTVNCAVATGYVNKALTYAVSSTSWSGANCGATTLPQATTCPLPTCGIFRCGLNGYQNDLNEAADKSNGLCAQTSCSQLITYISTVFDDDAKTCALIPQPAQSFCFSGVSSSVPGEYTYTYDSTGDACALATDEVPTPAFEGTCYSKACYGVVCGFGQDVESTFDANNCLDSTKPTCPCSCEKTCVATDVTVNSVCQLIADSTPVDVIKADDEDRYNTVCIHPDDPTRTCAIVTDECSDSAQVTSITIPNAIYMYQPKGVSITFKYAGPKTKSTTLTFYYALDVIPSTFTHTAFSITADQLIQDDIDVTLYKYVWDLKSISLPAASNSFTLYALVSGSDITIDTAQPSTAFTIGSFCQYQKTLPDTDFCSGHVDATCAEKSNQCTCPSFVAGYFPTTRNCSCPDLNPTDPKKCSFTTECTEVAESPVCVNGFHEIDADGKCLGDCVCTGSFSGAACDTCTTQCGTGTPNKTCTGCICPAGSAGPACQYTSIIAVQLKFAKAPANFLGAIQQQFESDLIAAIAEILGFSPDIFSISAAATPATNSSSPFTVLASTVNTDGSLTVNLGIATFTDASQGPTKDEATSMWTTKVTPEALNTYEFSSRAGGATKVSAVCDGTECPTETSTEDLGEKSAGQIYYAIITIVIVVALVVIALIIIIAVVCCNKTKTEEKVPQTDPSSTDSSKTPVQDSHLELV